MRLSYKQEIVSSNLTPAIMATDTSKFLQWVYKNYGRGIHERCQQVLSENPDADPILVLERVRMSVNEPIGGQPFGTIRYNT